MPPPTFYRLIDEQGITRLVVELDPPPGGGASPAALPTADPAGAVLDTTTYDNPITGTGKLTTLVMPADTGLLAVALAGDAFPRYLLASDPADGLYLGDGTVDPYADGGNLLVDSVTAGLGLTMFGISAVVSTATQPPYAPAGLGVFNTQTINLDSFSITFGTGAPTIGGYVGDLYVRIDAASGADYLYRCTASDVAGAATWVPVATYVPPQGFEQIRGNAATINNGSDGALPWNTVLGGDPLVDISNPLQPTIVAAGVYAIGVTLKVASMTVGGWFRGALTLDLTGNGLSIISDSPPTTATDDPILGLSLTGFIPAGGRLNVEASNFDGAAGRDFHIDQAVVQRIS